MPALEPALLKLLRQPTDVRQLLYRHLVGRLPPPPAMADDADEQHDEQHDDNAPKLYLTRIRLALAPYANHFLYPAYLSDKSLHMLEARVVKLTLEDTRSRFAVRQELGTSHVFWDDLAAVLKAAVPSLEKRCFGAPDPHTPEYDALCGPLIASFSTSLLRDLERLNQLVAIARNVVTFGEPAQNLCAERMFDKDVFALISVCVRVTARGYDGEAGTPDEDRWQAVINAYKKLLITALQFMNNLVARNEQRKLMMWIELFDSHLQDELPNFADMKYKMDVFPYLDEASKGRTDPEGGVAKTPNQPASSPFLHYVGELGTEIKKHLQANGQTANAADVATECRQRWQNMTEEDKKKWDQAYQDVVAKYREQITQSAAYQKVVDQHARNEESVQALAQSINQLQLDVERMKSSVISSDHPSIEVKVQVQPNAPAGSNLDHVDILAEPLHEAPRPAEENDFRMTYPPNAGAEMLREGKEDLLKRLDGQPVKPRGQVASPSSPVASPTSPTPESNVPREEAEDSDDEYDTVPGDDGRGLLTDVPLILGPTEIEVLPMVVMAGICEPSEGQPGYSPDQDVQDNIRSMHRVRCHLLLAQDNGRNLLRELLIFVAAWDLREEELYFKFMVRITEAILQNGLLPFAYHAFKDRSKDVISPAQAVIMKLLTNIFRSRQARSTTKFPHAPTYASPRPPPYQPDRADAHMVNFLLTEFRRHIIPQTCALIFLQGQIRAGHAQPDEFPMNLWDMERMYEGVYQYLEFFAILTESEVWKGMLSNWEIAAELVTVVRELDGGIPKGGLPSAPVTKASRSQNQAPVAEDANEGQPAPVAVERPYDALGSAPQDPYPTPSSPPRPFDESADEPSDFEWRNLKKLAVLVLSSLVWKNKLVQDQVRKHGGIEAILNCCSYDEHNPFIREHAIMCLRFLMESNAENQDRIRALERYENKPDSDESASTTPSKGNGKVKVPDEVLDAQGYETYMDNKGQVLLRKREAPAQPTLSSTAKGKAKVESALGEKGRDFEQLVQQVMRELPVRTPASSERERDEGVRKLDGVFDGRG